MSTKKRSNTWLEKKNQLLEEESTLRNELDETSDELEFQTKRLVKIVAITAGAALLGYGIYKVLKKKNVPEEETISAPVIVKEQAVVTQSTSLRYQFFERLFSTVVKIAGAQLGVYLAKKLGESISKPEETESELS